MEGLVAQSKPCVIEDNSNLWPGSEQALLIGQERGSTLVISACAKSRQSCPTLCDPLDRSLPGSSVHGILQARILEWVAISSPGDLPHLGIKPRSLKSPALAGGFFTWEAL